MARPGRFKKGAFRMAMAGGVPIVSIVIHNAVDALPKHGMIIRPASVDITVLPPVPTRDWLEKDLDEHVNAIRRDFIEVLGV